MKRRLELSDRLSSGGPRGRQVQRLRHDDGAAVIEAAFIAPVLLFLLMGIFEYGLFFRDTLGANDAADAGAKYGSIQGPDLARLTAADGSEVGFVTADYTIMLNTRSGLAGIDPKMIERVVIFKASDASKGKAIQQVPAACKTSNSSIAGQCNVYLMPSAFEWIERGLIDYFNADKVTCPGSSACGWKAGDRKDGPDPTLVDYLGVYIRLKRTPLTGLVPVPTTLEVASIHRLELGDID